jgi:predicted dehydrogenase
MNKKMNNKKTNKISRRHFVTRTAAATAGLTILPGSVISGLGYTAPSDKLNIAGVGVGGRGSAVLRGMASQNIVALCDTDWRYSKRIFDQYPNAKRYSDWRKMYDEMGDSVDAVMVATSDHTHADITAYAMTLNKHVYTEKPLTHSVYESRLLTKLAEKYPVATQMGNGGASNDSLGLIIEWIENGEIGEVKRVEAFTDRPIWPQGLNTPGEEMPVPSTMNWDVFVGPAKMRPFNEIYTPWNFRGWWDFGTGALGDMACHILQPVFSALHLQYPTKVQGTSTLLLNDSCPTAQKLRMIFPERPRRPKVNMPEVEVHWYDGGLKPLMPEGWPAGKNMNVGGGGVIFYGSKDILVCGSSSVSPWLMSGRVPKVPQTVRRVPGQDHIMDWVRACKENPRNRVETASNFSVAGPFNEMVVMGVLAVRLQDLHKELEWDGANMRFTNIGENETVRMVIEDGFTIEDGHPSFQKKWTDHFSARKFSEELIKHEYRQGWSLPPMPA